MIDFSIVKKLSTAQGELALNIDFQMEQGKTLALFGKSGAGKTTILRILAGLTAPDSGRIVVNNKVWYDSEKQINLAVQKRKIGFVFQNYALFPNLSVEDNVAFGTKNNKLVDELIQLSGLDQLRKRKPDTLSGGQQQRVALARALATEPEILLLDEALSALDFQTRLELQNKLIELKNRFNTTVIIVSHDLAEIFKLTGQVLVLNEGIVLQKGTPISVFSNDKISAKFQFIGEIVNIQTADAISIISVLVGNNIIRVIATNDEARAFEIAEKVLVASKAFNPIIQKLSEHQPTRIKNSWF